MLQQFKQTAMIVTGTAMLFSMSNCISVPVALGMKTPKEHRNDVKKEKEVTEMIKRLQREQKQSENNRTYFVKDSAQANPVRKSIYTPK